MTADFTARKINIGDSDYPAEYNQLIDDIEAEINTNKTDIATANTNIAARPLREDNLIINGDFISWQEGTSFPGLTNGSNGTYFADLFAFRESGAPTAVVTVSQSTDVPTVAESGHLSRYSLLVDCTTAQASSTTDEVCIRYGMEGYDWLNLAQTEWTLSFWHKHTKTGTYSVALDNSGNDRAYAANYTQSVSDTWEKAEITIPASPSAGTWDYTTGRGIAIYFALMKGSDNDKTISAGSWQTTVDETLASDDQVNALDSVSNNFRIAQVRPDIGSTAVPFIGRSIQEELHRIARYLLRPSTDRSWANGYVINSTTIRVNAAFPSEMRVAPTVTLLSSTPSIAAGNASFTGSGSTLVATTTSVTGFLTQITGFTGLTNQDGVQMNTGFPLWEIDARL